MLADMSNLKPSLCPLLHVSTQKLFVQLPGDRWQVMLSLQAPTLSTAVLKAVRSYPGIQFPLVHEQHDRMGLQADCRDV